MNLNKKKKVSFKKYFVCRWTMVPRVCTLRAEKIAETWRAPRRGWG